MISKTTLRKLYHQTMRKYPWSANFLITMLSSYRWIKHRLTHWPTLGKKPEPYSASAYNLYRRAQPYLNKSPHWWEIKRNK